MCNQPKVLLVVTKGILDLNDAEEIQPSAMVLRGNESWRIGETWWFTYTKPIDFLTRKVYEKLT